MSDNVEITVLVISDTHGQPLQYNANFEADLVIHCGDITDQSQLHDFSSSIDILKSLKAPVKLVIAGNHDFTLDEQAYNNMRDSIRRNESLNEGTVTETDFVEVYGEQGRARAVLEADDAKAAGIVYLEEGTHLVQLRDGIRLKVYASPHTPMAYGGNMGFQYDTTQPPDWQIPDDVDLVITHGPPQGIMDMVGKQRRGCPKLFSAIYRARPLLHCFGHIHSGWGARSVVWQDADISEPTHFNAIDHEASSTHVSLTSLRAGSHDDEKLVESKAVRLRRMQQAGFTSVDCKDTTQTLFVNAALQGLPGQCQQLPCLVTLTLPTDSGKQ